MKTHHSPHRRNPHPGALFLWLVTLLAVLSPLPGHAQTDTPTFDPGRAGFSIEVKDLTIRYRVMAIFILPESQHTLRITDSTGSVYNTTTDSGTLTQGASLTWNWTAPSKPGLYHLMAVRSEPADTIRLNAFVLMPLDAVHNGYLNGYRIGDYPKKPYKGLDQYRPPKGFVEVTPENENTLVSPHFRLKQFLCKQAGSYPKYVVLRELLLMKLELILRKLNEKGYACTTFNVMSGYRTPWYNKSIGNVKYSRHQWGGAADIFIDENPRDNVMDDLNGDGKSNWKDAAIVYTIIDDMYGEHSYKKFVGGLGRYRRTASHGPFVHVDVRGFRARWGD